MKPISRSQIVRLYAAASTNNWAKSNVHDLIRIKRGLPMDKKVSASHIDVDEYEWMMNVVQTPFDVNFIDDQCLIKFLAEFDGQVTQIDNGDGVRDVVNRSTAMPEVEQIESTEDEGHEPNDSLLNLDQQKAMSYLLDFMRSPQDEFILMGSAGTGKSYTISHFLRGLPVESHNEIAIAAPTHKAKKVLKAFIENQGLSIECKTIHSLLGMKMENSPEKRRKVLKNRKLGAHPLPIEAFKLIIIDESFMMNKILIDSIRDFLDITAKTGTKIIYLGDPLQLEPVGETESALKSKNCPSVELFKTERYSGPIADLVAEAKKSVRNQQRFMSNKIEEYICDSIVRVKNKFDAREYFVDLFGSQEYEKNPDLAKIVCFKNETVAKYNQLIRSIIHGLSVDELSEMPFIEGELLIANSPIKNQMGEIVYGNSEELLIEECFETSETYIFSSRKQEESFDTWSLLLKAHDGGTVRVWIPREESQDKLDFLLAKLRKEAITSGKGLIWHDYFELLDLFPKLQHSHALTVHKAQGSSYTNVFMSIREIDSCFDRQMQPRLWYTGLSRAKERILTFNE